MCGEQYFDVEVCSVEEGSSPRVRGTARRLFTTTDGDGIIPACAGNSNAKEASAAFKRDHPRVCGEQKQKPSLS